MREVTEVDLRLPHGRVARLTGDAGDASIIGSIRTAGGEYEPGLVSALTAVAGKDWTCLDIGANVGPVALTLAELCPLGQIHAFEPVPVTFEFLRNNIGRHAGATNVFAHHLALLDSGGEVVINYNPEFSGGAFISGHLEHGDKSTVPAMTLDDWVAKNGLERLDLIKLDVEGSELAVLDGAAGTLRRFRPALVVEINPITIRRMARGEPRDLYRRLRSIYGRTGHLAFIPDQGPMVPVASWRHVERVLAECGLTNLFCFPHRLVPGRSPGLAGPGATLREWWRGWRHYSRLGRPAWAALQDPHIGLRLDQLPTGHDAVISGRPGMRFDLPLLAYNRGDMTIVGSAPRFPVTTRVIWIDAAGNHIVDDRSRIGVPTMRPGAGAAFKMPLFLPGEPGHYGVRVTFFQEGMSWFHDLDAASALDIDVEVA